jgi:hypothetical protein
MRTENSEKNLDTTHNSTTVEGSNFIEFTAKTDGELVLTV